MERDRIPNPNFVEWMRKRIKLAGEEIINRADFIDFAGFDALTAFNIDIWIPTMADSGDYWPSLTFSAICGDATMVDELCSGSFNPYPPEQFVEVEENADESST